jgi:GcrA cell cycle regulator
MTDWTEELTDRARALWDEGHSTAEIGRRLGVSKNAVIGKAHRLDWPARPSPIKNRWPDSTTRPPPQPGQPRVPPVTLAPLPSLSAPATREPIVIPEPPPRPPPPKPVFVAPPKPAALPKPYGRVTTCCWPIGEPGTLTFRFCNAESVPGKSYCAEHAQLAYVRVRDRREDRGAAD